MNFMLEFLPFLMATTSAVWIWTDSRWKKINSFKEIAVSLVPVGAIAAAFQTPPGTWQEAFARPIEWAAGIAICLLVGRTVWRKTAFESTVVDMPIGRVMLDTPAAVSGALRRVATERARLQNETPKFGFNLGGVQIPVEKETEHIWITGNTGGGKSQLVQPILDYTQNSKRIVIDFGGESTQSRLRDGDIILNPNDLRSAEWSIFAEMRHSSDAERLAKSIIPDAVESSKEWNAYAQTIVTETLKQIFSGHSSRKMDGGGKQNEKWEGTNEELFQRLIVDSVALNASRFEGSGVYRLLGGGEESTMVSNIMGIVGRYITPYQKLPKKAGKNSFSIRKWIEDENDTSTLWITFDSNSLHELSPLIAAWLGIAISSILSLPSKRSRRIWVIGDEIPVLGKVNGLDTLLTNGRKYGAACVFSSQSMNQWFMNYGEKLSKVIFSSMRTWIVFAHQENSENEYMANAFGKQKIKRQIKTKNGWSTSVTEEHVVPAADIAGLEKMHCYLRFSEKTPACKISIPITETKIVAPAFVYEDGERKAETEKDREALLKSYSPDDVGADQQRLPEAETEYQEPTVAGERQAEELETEEPVVDWDKTTGEKWF